MTDKSKDTVKSRKSLRSRVHEIVYEADTTAGKFFDILVLVAIVISVMVVMLESITELQQKYGTAFYVIEWALTILFTIEYLVRIWVIQKPSKYIFSFFGLIDFFAILPTYLSLFVAGSQHLLIIRSLRLLRIFRIFKLSRYVTESQILVGALYASRTKIIIFIFTVLMLICIIGSLMYLVEGPDNGFTSIPTSIYWAIVTMTTVGYGDITPGTSLGKFLSSIIMILGYGILAVPTGIVGSELFHAKQVQNNTQSCKSCNSSYHDDDAVYCKYCGESLD